LNAYERWNRDALSEIDFVISLLVNESFGLSFFCFRIVGFWKQFTRFTWRYVDGDIFSLLFLVFSF